MRKNILLKILIIIMVIIVYSIVNSNTSFCATSTQVYTRNFEDIQIQEINDNATDTTAATVSINALIGAGLTLVQIFGIWIGFLLIIISVIKHIMLLGEKKNSSSLEDKKRLEEKIIINKKAMVLSIILEIVLFFIAGSLQVIKSFKPIIYLYPEKEQKVKVKLKNKEKLTCTYPKYKDSWEVMAKPNGDLVDCETGRNLYALYWEGKNTVKHNLKEGFVVKGEDSIKFLEEKLEILGLNEREAEEFIVYWLPKLESNKYNFIRFETMEEIEEDMPLEIEPKPDSVIRVMMVFKGLKIPMEVKEQKLEKPERKGFTVVEWGGTEI